jgi:hypothetical protein
VETIEKLHGFTIHHPTGKEVTVGPPPPRKNGKCCRHVRRSPWSGNHGGAARARNPPSTGKEVTVGPPPLRKTANVVVSKGQSQGIAAGIKPTCACIERKTIIIKSIVVGIRRTATGIESTAAGIKGIVQCTQASIRPLTSKGDAEEQSQSIVAGMQALSALPYYINLFLIYIHVSCRFICMYDQYIHISHQSISNTYTVIRSVYM